MDQIEEALNREEFIEAAIRLYDTLNQAEKSAIFRFEKKKNYTKKDYLLD